MNIDPVNRPERYLTLDHVYPKSKGGNDEDSNLQTLCNKCNCAKGEERPPSTIYV